MTPARKGSGAQIKPAALRRWIAAGTIATTLVGGGLLLIFARLQAGKAVWTDGFYLNGSQWFDAARTTVTLVGIIGLGGAAFLAYRKQVSTEASHLLEQSTGLRERYTTTAEQLGHDSAAIRLAGVYALASLADDWHEFGNDDERQVCIDLLCAYLRTERPASSGGPRRAMTPVNRQLAGRRSSRLTPAPREKRIDDEEQNVRSAIVEAIAARTRNANETNGPWAGCKFALSGAHLPGAKMADANLTGAHLFGADLSGAILIRTVLNDAHLKGADLTGASIFRATLTSATLAGATLTGADLTGATLVSAILFQADLTAARLSGANLSGADLTGATLTKAYLFEANLTSATLVRANLARAKLSGAKLSDATLTKANLPDADLSGANLSGANLSGANFTNATLTGVILTPSNLANAATTPSNLINANLSGANLSGVNLSGVNLSGTNLSGANLSGAYLNGAKLNGAHLTGADLTDAELAYADLTGISSDADTRWPEGFSPPGSVSN